MSCVSQQEDGRRERAKMKKFRLKGTLAEVKVQTIIGRNHSKEEWIKRIPTGLSEVTYTLIVKDEELINLPKVLDFQDLAITCKEIR